MAIAFTYQVIHSPIFFDLPIHLGEFPQDDQSAPLVQAVQGCDSDSCVFLPHAYRCITPTIEDPLDLRDLNAKNPYALVLYSYWREALFFTLIRSSLDLHLIFLGKGIRDL